MRSDATNVRNIDQVTGYPVIKAAGSGPDTTEYPNNGPAPAGAQMPWQGGWRDSQGLRGNNATPGRSADLPQGNGPIPGVTRK